MLGPRSPSPGAGLALGAHSAPGGETGSHEDQQLAELGFMDIHQAGEGFAFADAWANRIRVSLFRKGLGLRGRSGSWVWLI